MKVVPNGGLNLSVLDGWWAEAYRPGVGWAIGDGQEFVHAGYQDEVDAEALYSLLENEVVPLFYNRDADGLPRGWIAHDEELHPGAGRPPSRASAWSSSTPRSSTCPSATATGAWSRTTSPRPRSSPPGGSRCATTWCDVKVTGVESRTRRPK